MRVAAALVLVASLLTGACRSAPRTEAEPPPPDFPQGWSIVDLTRPLDHAAPWLPHAQGFRFERIALEGDAFGRAVGAWSALGHTGTHVESAATFGGPGAPVARIPAAHLVLPLVVLDAPPPLADGEPVAVGVLSVTAYEAAYERIPRGALVLLRTGTGSLDNATLAADGRLAPERRTHAGFSDEAVRFLAAERGVRALGTDALAIDRGPDLESSPAARAAADSGLFTVTSLANLGPLPRRGAIAIVGVLPVADAVASQARVLALVPPHAVETAETGSRR